MLVGGRMKKTVLVVLLGVMVGLAACSVQKGGSTSGLGVMFDGEPLIFDSSVVFMGDPVGRILSHEWANGVARVSIGIDGQYENLKRNNMAAVVKNGRLHLNAISGYGDPLPPGGCIMGFTNMTSFRLFKVMHLINNITMSADRRAQYLLARSGLAG